MTNLDDIRRRLGGTLRNELSEAAIAVMERRVHNYDAVFRENTSGKVMIEIAQDIQEAHELLEGSHTPDIQRRLLEVLTRLCGMLGIALLHLGDTRAADQWLNTAEMAAESNGDRELRAWVAARQALVPLYYGNNEDALVLATQARNLAGPQRASVAGARAEIVRARVYAQMPGEESAALTAAERARSIHANLSGPAVRDGILGLTGYQVAGHLGEVFTRLGRTTEAYEQQAVVLNRVTGFSPTTGCVEPDGCLNVTLAKLQRALGHIYDGEPEEACRLAARALVEIPDVCCTRMVQEEARGVAHAVPERARSARAFAELTGALAFRASS
jgi:hypothetical protein